MNFSTSHASWNPLNTHELRSSTHERNMNSFVSPNDSTFHQSVPSNYNREIEHTSDFTSHDPVYVNGSSHEMLGGGRSAFRGNYSSYDPLATFQPSPHVHPKFTNLTNNFNNSIHNNIREGQALTLQDSARGGNISWAEKAFDRAVWVLESILDLYTKIVYYQNQYHPAYNRRFESSLQSAYQADDRSVAYGTWSHKLQQQLHRFINNFSHYQNEWKRRIQHVWHRYSNRSTRMITILTALGSSILILFWKYQFLRIMWKDSRTFNPDFLHEPTFAVSQSLSDIRRQRQQIRDTIPEGWRRTFFGYEMSQEERRMDLNVDSHGRVTGLKRYGDEHSATNMNFY